MEILLNPNIAYLLLVAGTFFVLVAMVAPGTGLPEVIAIFSMVLAGYAVYHLSVNWWALALLFLSLVPFFLAVRGGGNSGVPPQVWLLLAITGLTVGSAFFFPTQHGLASVNPAVALTTSALYAVLVWFSVRKVTQIAQAKPLQDISIVLGQHGEAKTPVEADGSVQVAGELWSARSETPIPAGKPIRVLGREGFVLIVEKDSLRELELQKE